MLFNKKTTLLIVTMLMVTTSTVWAQFAYNFNPKPAKGIIIPRENNAQRWSFGLNYGLHPISVQASSIQLKYTDESPAPDVLIQNITTLASKGAMVIGGGFEWQSKRNLMHRIYFAGGKNGASNTRAGYFSFGMGYAMGSNRFQFYPMIDLVASNATIDFGSLVNTTGIVQINDTKFDVDKISTSLKLSFAGIRPSVGFHFAITKRIGIQASIGYLNANPNDNANIEFSATNPKAGENESSTLSATEKLSEANVSFLVNNKRVTSRPDIFAGKGLSYNIGLTFGKNRLFER